jgi:hypothetical protein
MLLDETAGLPPSVCAIQFGKPIFAAKDLALAAICLYAAPLAAFSLYKACCDCDTDTTVHRQSPQNREVVARFSSKLEETCERIAHRPAPWLMYRN